MGKWSNPEHPVQIYRHDPAHQSDIPLGSYTIAQVKRSLLTGELLRDDFFWDDDEGRLETLALLPLKWEYEEEEIDVGGFKFPYWVVSFTRTIVITFLFLVTSIGIIYGVGYFKEFIEK